jgi:hypothetical protein
LTNRRIRHGDLKGCDGCGSEENIEMDMGDGIEGDIMRDLGMGGDLDEHKGWETGEFNL